MLSNHKIERNYSTILLTNVHQKKLDFIAAACRLSEGSTYDKSTIQLLCLPTASIYDVEESEKKLHQSHTAEIARKCVCVCVSFYRGQEQPNFCLDLAQCAHCTEL